jgi:hypothetical protein
MPYLPTKFFTGATTIVAEDVQENIDELRDYISGGLRATDFQTTSWAGPRHIMRGRYDPIVNSHRFTSGVNAGRNSEPNEMSWVNKGSTDAAGGSSPSYNYLPNSAVTFHLEASAHVILQFYASPVCPLWGASKRSRIYLALDDTRILMTRNTIRSESPAFGPTVAYPGEHQSRNNFAGFHMATLSAGTHSLSLTGYTDSSNTFFCNWGVSVEAYYK